MIQFLIEILLRISEFSLIALGLSLVYGLVKFPNVAHVQYAMLGAYLMFFFIHAGLPPVAALVLSSLSIGVFAAVVHKLVFSRLLRTGPAITMIGSLAIAMIIGAVILGVAGSFPYVPQAGQQSTVTIAGVFLSAAQTYKIGTTVCVIVLFWMFWTRTRLGRSMRALSSNPVLADASGLNASRTVLLVAFASGVLAGLGGCLLGMSSGAYSNMGNDLLLPVFAAAILGGLGNPLGAVLGAAFIALVETIVTNVDFGWLVGQDMAFIPLPYLGTTSFLILLLALLFRPYGLFDKEVRRV
ncbi:branched-chain amino acid ABC transporter permease [Bordetella genomosp. 12]|uniref:Branched-chain amino acid ABC transporter permease n=1 Tax=Bordetella genomosp. 12 TaxID=463035 RepID=A0A261VAM8_9BORD|nr:branched-chain amino acid ABC transporter permease [Bordetella genomosp. 12]OZI70877.1 branched-chain amino acid ABC transporter permease [Bordetella genomosp. 12]